jgi:protein-S-isoprenylcysteine O-methyltransferase Ste14
VQQLAGEDDDVGLHPQFVRSTHPQQGSCPSYTSTEVRRKQGAMSNLLVKTLLGFLALMLSLALALFLSAGSWSFWRAWSYLAVFAVCVILITAYLVKYNQELLAHRVKAGPIAETQKTQKLITGLANLFFLGLFIVSGLDFRFHWSEVPLAVSWSSDGLVALGFFIVFRVFRENTYASAIIEVAQEQRVVATGPYGVVRHPMYSGAILLLVFTPLALGSWVGVPFSLPLILAIAVRLLEEEKFLRVHLRGYEEYRRQVRYRLIPFIW